MAVISNLNTIKDLLRNLIEQFDQAHSLISLQIQCVVRQQLEELNEHIEHQNTVNSTINSLEEEFRQSLIIAFNSIKVKTKSYSLTTLLPYIDRSDEEIVELRDALKDVIHKTKSKQVHLLQLLQFAQEHVAETMRAIFQLSDASSTHYKSTGKKALAPISSKLINQTV
ncbi:hypothetical protein EP331_15070 [bacterium]|nr:MAG: hypothetical protein EP331_15070 [bacterium]